MRDVPDAVHRTLKSRAALSGVSLSEYVRAELTRLASMPAPEEVRARLQALPRLREPKQSPEAIIRRLRGPLP